MQHSILKSFAVAAFATAFAWQAHAADRTKVKLAEVVRSQLYVPMYVALNKGFAAAEFCSRWSSLSTAERPVTSSPS